jgi:hypothetical protein
MDCSEFLVKLIGTLFVFYTGEEPKLNCHDGKFASSVSEMGLNRLKINQPLSCSLLSTLLIAVNQSK